MTGDQAERPVGVFDSGVGGLGILFELERVLPQESFVYFADALRCPWGSRPETEIIDLAVQATESLLAEGAKLVVVACNSATTLAISTLRERYPVPFVGTEPAVKPASARSRTRRVGVMATAATVGSPSLRRLAEQYANGVAVTPFACPDRLVELVEAGVVSGAEIVALLEPIADRVHADELDVLVLGCTHYVFLRPIIEDMVGPNVAVIDTSAAVARQVARLLAERELSASQSCGTTVRYLSSGSQAELVRIAEVLRAVGTAEQ